MQTYNTNQNTRQNINNYINNEDWVILEQPQNYHTIDRMMEEMVDKVISKNLPHQIILSEIEDIITAGTGAKTEEIPGDLEVVKVGRGGKLTFHGLGQRVVYPIIDLAQEPWNCDLKKYIDFLHEWIIATLKEFGIDSYRRSDHVGVWTRSSGAKQDEKIAAIGVRARKWVTYHGFAVNLHTSLDKYKNFTPCGISDLGVTSAKECGKIIGFNEFDNILKRQFYTILQAILQEKKL